MFERLCLIGMGLIGGSIAKTARIKQLCRSTVGFDQDYDVTLKAKSLGVVDVAADTILDAVQGADLVIISTPVGAMESILRALKASWSDAAVYTDVGSTKVSVVNAARAVFGDVPANFIPGHPIAGAELSGVEAAIEGLFENKRVILTPLPASSPGHMARIRDFWDAMGGTVSEMTADHHDDVLAATSHFPHLLAFALTDLLGRKDEKREILKFAAGGFKDFSRIASSDPRMWRDICLANSGAILPLIEEFQQELERISQFIEAHEGDDLQQIFHSAGNARGRFLEQYLKI